MLISELRGRTELSERFPSVHRFYAKLNHLGVGASHLPLRNKNVIDLLNSRKESKKSIIPKMLPKLFLLLFTSEEGIKALKWTFEDFVNKIWA